MNIKSNETFRINEWIQKKVYLNKWEGVSYGKEKKADL